MMHQTMPKELRQGDGSGHKKVFGWIGVVLANCESAQSAAEVVKRWNAHDALLAACEQFAEAFDDLFARCCSSPVTNAWGKPVDMTKLNEANEAARAALALAREPEGK